MANAQINKATTMTTTMLTADEIRDLSTRWGPDRVVDAIHYIRFNSKNHHGLAIQLEVTAERIEKMLVAIYGGTWP